MAGLVAISATAGDGQGFFCTRHGHIKQPRGFLRVGVFVLLVQSLRSLVVIRTRYRFLIAIFVILRLWFNHILIRGNLFDFGDERIRFGAIRRRIRMQDTDMLPFQALGLVHGKHQHAVIDSRDFAGIQTIFMFAGKVQEVQQAAETIALITSNNIGKFIQMRCTAGTISRQHFGAQIEDSFNIRKQIS